jgi:hypothetical protein
MFFVMGLKEYFDAQFERLQKIYALPIGDSGYVYLEGLSLVMYERPDGSRVEGLEPNIAFWERIHKRESQFRNLDNEGLDIVLMHRKLGKEQYGDTDFPIPHHIPSSVELQEFLQRFASESTVH